MSTTQQLLDDLDALDALFSDESKWTKRLNARAVDGGEAPPLSHNAVCWCLEGGVARVTGRVFPNARYYNLLDEFRITCGADEVYTWNDSRRRTFVQVKKLIADTRARVAAQEQA
jgi:hypothetical protein